MRQLVMVVAVAAGCQCTPAGGGKGGGKDVEAPIRNGKPGPGGGDRTCDGAAGGGGGSAEPAAKFQPPKIPNGEYRGQPNHPRLFWTPASLARAKAWVDKSFHPKDDDIMGNAMLCAVTHDRSAGKVAIGNLEKIMHDDLFKSADQVRWQGENAIVAYDWCFDQLSPQTKADFTAYANKWFAKWNEDEWGGVGHEEGNYYWGHLRNGLEWALASGPDGNAAAPGLMENALVTRWEKSFLPYAQGLQRGGLPSEGTQYGRYQENYPLIAFVTLANGGRKIFDETDWYRGVVYYNIHNTLPGVTKRAGKDAHDLFPAEDDQFWLDGNSAHDEDYGNLMTAVAWQWPDKPVGQHARWFLGAMSSPRAAYFTGADSGVAGAKPADLLTIPLDYYAPGAGYLWARNKWSRDASILFAQLGFAQGAGHQQWDAGSFQLWRKGRWLTRETTSYVDEIQDYQGAGKIEARNSIGHNTVLFGGKGSARGYYDGFPQVQRLESRKDYVYAATDLSKFYRSTASDHTDRDDNPFAKSLVREIVYLRDAETLVVLDRMEAGDASLDRKGWTGAKIEAAKVAKTFVVHFEQGVKVKTEGPVTTAVNGDQQLRVTTLVPAAPAAVHLVDERVKPEDNLGQQRLEIEAPLGSAQGYFVTVLQAGDAGAAVVAPKVVESADAFAVTVGGATITFAKGMASKGGTIATPGCAVHPLADYVQNIRVTDDGPIWGP